MTWLFSKAMMDAYGNSRSLPELVAEFSPATFSDGEPFAQWSETLFAPDDSCSDKMSGICHRSPSGMMFVPSTDYRGEALLTSFQAVFPVKPIPPQLEEGMLRMISGRKCGGSWQMSLLGTYLPRTPSDVRSTGLAMTLRRWVIQSVPLHFPRATWVLTTFGSATGFLHTPTGTANYNSPSMQKWPSCREFVRVFGRPDPINHEWLMAWPIGWTDSQRLVTDKFQSWRQQHSPFLQTDKEPS